MLFATWLDSVGRSRPLSSANYCARDGLRADQEIGTAVGHYPDSQVYRLRQVYDR